MLGERESFGPLKTFAAAAINCGMKQSNLLFIMFDDLRLTTSVYQTGKDYLHAPNFERLADKSVTFDHAFTQISICNPARNCLLTGLRPDTVGIYGFEGTFKPYLTLPTLLMRAGYKTVGVGKILHWDSHDKETWTLHDSSLGPSNLSWYEYQDNEWLNQTSSVVPDHVLLESQFPDFTLASRTIDHLHSLAAGPSFFMLAVGFKLPHTQLHVPAKYFDMYRDRATEMWATSDIERTFPPTAPSQSYRCCEGDEFIPLPHNESVSHDRKTHHGDTHHSSANIEFSSRDNVTSTGDINYTIPASMYTELMCGYSAAVTFLDVQLGRILDAIDELQLWTNLTIVLTSDHGMHNGEKGMWDKWSLFDESTRVPLLIAHPLSPYQGRRYRPVVEAIDVFPSVLDLLGVRYSKKRVYSLPGARFDRKYVAPQGSSLAAAVLGRNWKTRLKEDQPTSPNLSSSQHEGALVTARAAGGGGGRLLVPAQGAAFAVSQLLVCTQGDPLAGLRALDARVNPSLTRVRTWVDCNLTKRYQAPPGEWGLMGYSLRSLDWRYTAWLPINRTTVTPLLWRDPVDEELYDHRGESSLDAFGHVELVNVARERAFASTVQRWRLRLYEFLRERVYFYRNSSDYGKSPTTTPRATSAASKGKSRGKAKGRGKAKISTKSKGKGKRVFDVEFPNGKGTGKATASERGKGN